MNAKVLVQRSNVYALPPENDPLRRLAVYMASAAKLPSAVPIEWAVSTMRQMKIPVVVKSLGTQRAISTPRNWRNSCDGSTRWTGCEQGTCNAEILGVAAVAFLLAAGALWFWRPESEAEPGFFSRMGAVLAAAWLACEDIQRLPGWLVLLLPAVLIVIVRCPRLLLLLIPALVVWVILRRVLSSGQR